MQTLDRNCEIIMITILKVLMDRWTIYISGKNFISEMESINKSQMEMLEMRNIVSWMNFFSCGFINKLDIVEIESMPLRIS